MALVGPWLFCLKSNNSWLWRGPCGRQNADSVPRSLPWGLCVQPAHPLLSLVLFKHMLYGGLTCEIETDVRQNISHGALYRICGPSVELVPIKHGEHKHSVKLSHKQRLRGKVWVIYYIVVTMQKGKKVNHIFSIFMFQWNWYLKYNHWEVQRVVISLEPFILTLFQPGGPYGRNEEILEESNFFSRS